MLGLGLVLHLHTIVFLMLRVNHIVHLLLWRRGAFYLGFCGGLLSILGLCYYACKANQANRE